MSKRKGTVSNVGKSQYSYFIQLDGEPFYYNTKFEPKCGKDDVVGITFTKTDEKRGNITKVVVLEKNSDGYKPTTTSGHKAGGGGGDSRQESIVYQSSRKDALQLTTILIAAEGFALKGKPDAKRVQIEELVDELTARLFKDAIDPQKSGPLSGGSSDDDDDGSDDWDKSDDASGDDDWEKDDTWED